MANFAPTVKSPRTSTVHATAKMSFPAAVRADILAQFEDMKLSYESWVNEQRALKSPGKKLNRFSCRDNATSLTIPLCLRFMLGMQGTDIHAELVNSHLFRPDHIPSESSFCQVRDKIPLHLFENLFHWFSNKYYWNAFHNFCGYRFFAVDGSEHAYPANISEPDNFCATRSDTRARNALHINGLFDVDHSFYLDILVQDIHSKNERSAYYQFMKNIADRFPNPDLRQKCVFITDRGYEAWNVPVLAEHYGVSYLCRFKDDSASAILSSLREYLPHERNSYDRIITLTLTRDPEKKALHGYHYLAPGVSCDLITRAKDVTVQLRVVKIRITEDVTEFLFTNLPKESFSREALKNLYHERWKVETGFSFIKYPCCLSAPHALSRVPVLKECYCRFLLYNCVSAIVYHDDEFTEKKEVTGRKYDYTRDFSSSIADVRYYLLSDEDYDLDAVIARNIRPADRCVKSTPRHKTPRKPPKTGHRQG